MKNNIIVFTDLDGSLLNTQNFKFEKAKSLIKKIIRKITSPFNSIPLLDYSTHSDYGAQYGANFLAPIVTFGNSGDKHLKNAKVYHPEEELDPMYKMKYFLDNVWYSQGSALPNICLLYTSPSPRDS